MAQVHTLQHPELAFSWLCSESILPQPPSTSRMWAQCSSQLSLYTTRSSRYASAKFPIPCRRWSIIRWNVAGAPLKPKGMTRNWNRPVGEVKVVFGRFYATETCQYPRDKSRVLIYFAPPSLSMRSLIRGIGYASKGVTALSRL